MARRPYNTLAAKRYKREVITNYQRFFDNLGIRLNYLPFNSWIDKYNIIFKQGLSLPDRNRINGFPRTGIGSIA